MPALGMTAFPVGSEVFGLARALLMDADIPSISNITPTGAVRASGVVTITTSQPHGLQPGNIVQVASVSDSSFSGTQTLQTASGTTFTYSQAGVNASSGNGVVSLVIQGDWATDTVLLPFANKAYRKLQVRLQAAGSKTMSSEAYVTLVANATQLLDTTNPQLPVDFLAPRDLSERINGSGLAYAPMQQVNIIPSFPSATILNRNGMYAWYEDGIYFPGCANKMDLRIRYFVAFPDISDKNGSFTIRGSQDCIASLTTYYAALSRGAENAGIFSQIFEDDLKDLLNTQAHARNYVVGRRRPNNSGRGRGSSYLGRVL